VVVIKTEKKPRHRFPPGNNANPKGRPKGSRNKLGEAFFEAMCADFERHGSAAIARVREESPVAYLRAMCQLVPKDLSIDAPVDGLQQLLLELDQPVFPGKRLSD
jgi:hypothetical protein